MLLGLREQLSDAFTGEGSDLFGMHPGLLPYDHDCYVGLNASACARAGDVSHPTPPAVGVGSAST
jgi:hypothetical protein